MMQRSRVISGLWISGRCCRQRTRCLATTSPFATFISDVNVPKSVAASVAEPRRSAPRLSSLGDIEIPSSIPLKSSASLFAARAAQRQKKLQPETTSTVEGSEIGLPNVPKATTSALRSLLSRKSQRVPFKDGERRSIGGPSNPQSGANVRPMRHPDVGSRSALAEFRTDRRREGSRKVARPTVVKAAFVQETSLIEELQQAGAAAPPVLHVSFNNTDFSELFSPTVPTSSVLRPLVAQSRIDSRMQLLKERAGDYSRYLLGNIDPTAQTVGSAGYAKLILARRRDVGLKPRRIVVELIHQAGVNVNSKSASATPS